MGAGVQAIYAEAQFLAKSKGRKLDEARQVK